MSRRQKAPLRLLSGEERNTLGRLSRLRSTSAAEVARATALLAVSDGQSHTTAAWQAGRRTGDTVARWVARFNDEGLAAVTPRHGGGPSVRYGETRQRRILAEAERTPDRAREGTATWSLSTLQRALRQASNGLPAISTHTIWRALHAAGRSWQRNRTWCDTGVVERRRKTGTVTVADQDAVAKRG
jgi:transposase